MELVLVLCDLKRLFGGCGVGDFERFDFLAADIDHKNGAPQLYIGIYVGGKVADETGNGVFTRSFGTGIIHIGSILGGGGEANEQGMLFDIAIREDDFGAIEGDVFDDVFFGSIGDGTFYLEFGHGPEEQLVYGVGIGGVAIGFVFDDPFPIDFFQGKEGEFGIVGADGDFIDLFRVFEGEQIVGDSGGLVAILPEEGEDHQCG